MRLARAVWWAGATGVMLAVGGLLCWLHDLPQAMRDYFGFIAYGVREVWRAEYKGASLTD